MNNYDFVDLKLKIYDTIIKIVNLFTEKNINDIILVKSIIKYNLMNNPNSYIDYENNMFNIISLMLSHAIANDCESFCSIFLGFSFLFEEFIKYENDDKMNENIGDILGKLFFYFQEKKDETVN